MTRYLAVMAGALFAVVLLAPDRADAGASASAPSKYAAQSRQTVATHQVRHAKRPDVAITEYSSSSAKTTSPRR